MAQTKIDIEHYNHWLYCAEIWFSEPAVEDAVWRCLLRAVSGMEQLS